MLVVTRDIGDDLIEFRLDHPEFSIIATATSGHGFVSCVKLTRNGDGLWTEKKAYRSFRHCANDVYDDDINYGRKYGRKQ